MNFNKLLSLILIKKPNGQTKQLLNNMMQFIKFAQSNQEFSIQLTEDILDFVQISQDMNIKLRLSVSVFDLRKFITDTYELMSLKLNTKKLALKYSITNLSDCKQLIVRNCQKRLKQLMINLISNAIKFTQEGQIWLNVIIR